MPDPDLTSDIPESSDDCEMNVIYSVNLRFYDAIEVERNQKLLPSVFMIARISTLS